MEVQSTFEIPATADEAWALLLDVPRVVPCMPGATLVDVVGDDAWKAQLQTRLGPVSLSFDADVERREVDAAARTVTLAVAARERSGRGGATATIVSSLDEQDGRAVAQVTTDLALTGTVARFGRAGLVKDVAAQMTDQFAANLRRELGGEAPAASPAAADAPTGRPSAATGTPAAAPAGAAPPKASRMIAGIILRSWIRRLERWLARVEGGA